MFLRDLPPEATRILALYHAPSRLIAHLTVVHDTAHALLEGLDAYWPELQVDRPAVLIGAATHDIGKVVYKDELTGPGHLHEEIGPRLLVESGLPEAYARFARTHARWAEEQTVKFEDLLVAFADTIWKGKRDAKLEDALVQKFAAACQEDKWDVYMKFSDLADELAREAHARILWQGEQY